MLDDNPNISKIYLGKDWEIPFPGDINRLIVEKPLKYGM